MRGEEVNCRQGALLLFWWCEKEVSGRKKPALLKEGAAFSVPGNIEKKSGPWVQSGTQKKAIRRRRSIRQDKMLRSASMMLLPLLVFSAIGLARAQGRGTCDFPRKEMGALFTLTMLCFVAAAPFWGVKNQF